MACNKWYAAAVGIVLLAAGLTLFIGKYPSELIDNAMNDQLVISLNSPVYDDWMTPPPPIYMQYWLFNVTNPKEVIEGGKANVTEMGPYTYQLYQPRFNAIFYDNRSVSYQYNHTLVFRPEMSNGSETDIVINVNVPLLTVSAMLKYKHLNALEKGILEEIIKILGDSDTFPQHTVKELLFGYTDKVLNFASELLSVLGINFPGEFGIFYGFNNSDDGVYLINSGKNNISLANHMEKWNHQPLLDYWPTTYANMLNGTDGVFFNPGLKENDVISTYSTDVCRSLDFHYEMATAVKKIKTLRFHLTADTFANNTVNPDNTAFCSGHCLDSGVLNISVCKQNAPVIISSPHFYMGADQYINGVNGLHPTKEMHETYLDVEPQTGTVCKANKRLQVNILN